MSTAQTADLFCQSSHRVGFGKELLVFVVESIVEEQGIGAVPAKKHVYREYITIKSHPMDDSTGSVHYPF